MLDIHLGVIGLAIVFALFTILTNLLLDKLVEDDDQPGVHKAVIMMGCFTYIVSILVLVILGRGLPC